MGARSEPLVDAPAGTKPVAFAAIPAFDQLTEYVYQTPPTQTKSGISVGVAVGTVVPNEASASDLMMPPSARTAVKVAPRGGSTP